MIDVKAGRLIREHKASIEVRAALVARFVGQYAATHPSTIIPCVGDVCREFEGVRDVVLASDTGVQLSNYDLEEAVPHFPQFCEDWRRQKDMLLAGLLPPPVAILENISYAAQPSVDQDPDPSRLQLATTYFRCIRCKETMHYPRILNHSCLTALPDRRDRTYIPPPGEVILKQVVWNHDSWVEFSSWGSDIISHLVLACGEDPTLITAAQMDEKDARFECLACQRGGYNRQVWSWRMAV